MGHVSNDSFVRRLEQPQATPVSTGEKAAPTPIEAKTGGVGTSAFEELRSEVSNIENSYVITMRGGVSPPDAKCCSLRDITSKCIAAIARFQPAVGEKTAAKKTGGQQPRQELAEELSTAAEKVKGGEVSSQQAVQLAHFGRHQQKLYGEWKKSVSRFIDGEQQKLPHTSSREKAAVEDRIQTGKAVLGTIEGKERRLEEATTKLESAISSKYGREALDTALPKTSTGPGIVHRLVRFR